MGSFPLIVGFSVCLIYFVGIIICTAYIFSLSEMDIASQCSKIIYDIIDTKIVTMNSLLQICIIIFACSTLSQVCVNDRALLIERHLTHTIKGIVCVIDNLRHTVLSSLHHHTATKHTTEIGALYGVHDTSSIDGTYTILFPIILIDCLYCCFFINVYNGMAVTTYNGSTVIFDKQCQQVITIQGRSS